MLQCVAVCGRFLPVDQPLSCCSVLQCVAVCCSVVVCCSEFYVFFSKAAADVLQYVAMRCIALQCDAVCCSVLQCVAVCCSVLQCVVVLF